MERAVPVGGWSRRSGKTMRFGYDDGYQKPSGVRWKHLGPMGNLVEIGTSFIVIYWIPKTVSNLTRNEIICINESITVKLCKP